MPWTVDDYFEGTTTSLSSPKSTLVCIDNMEHEHTTAHLVTAEAERLGLSDHLQFVEADAFDILDAPHPSARDGHVEGGCEGGGDGSSDGGGRVVDWKTCSYDLMFLDGITGECVSEWGQVSERVGVVSGHTI